MKPSYRKPIDTAHEYSRMKEILRRLDAALHARHGNNRQVSVVLSTEDSEIISNVLREKLDA